MNAHLLQLPADLMGLDGLHNSISLLVQVSDVLPKTIDHVLPHFLVGQVWSHRPGIGA